MKISSKFKILSRVKNHLNRIDVKTIASKWLIVPYFTTSQRDTFTDTGDPVRYATVFLAIQQVLKDKIDGSIAECGVYKGVLSKFLHTIVPDRKLFMFDTFKGFDSRDSDSFNKNDNRFNDTSVNGVLNYIGDANNIFIREGYFPETVSGLESEEFALVIIDFDKYEPTLAALEFFYPRINTGGFVFVHDYSSPESNYGCSRALDKFLIDKSEKPLLIPDAWGSAFFRKV